MNDGKCPTCGDYIRDCICCIECGALYGECWCGAEPEDSDEVDEI